MKRGLFILLVIFVLMPIVPGFAQNPVSVIDTLAIEIWPDYDRASVLVMLTGTLAGDTLLPASVSLSLPEAARINAVARIDPKDGKMKDDIIPRTDPPGTLTFNTPDLRFRVEYYLPYTVNESQRSFDFNWLAAVSVNNFQPRVQRPSSAGTFSTKPAAVNVIRGDDGFEYHTFPSQSVPAGKSFSLGVVYTMTSAQLSAARLPPPDIGTQSPAVPAVPVAPGTGSGFSWALVALIAGGLLIFGALIWQLASRRPAADISEPVDPGVKKQSRAKFCRDCGEVIDKGDRFCRGCGSKV